MKFKSSELTNRQTIKHPNKQANKQTNTPTTYKKTPKQKANKHPNKQTYKQTNSTQKKSIKHKTTPLCVDGEAKSKGFLLLYYFCKQFALYKYHYKITWRACEGLNVPSGHVSDPHKGFYVQIAKKIIDHGPSF